jgi:hypothetical protein
VTPELFQDATVDGIHVGIDFPDTPDSRFTLHGHQWRQVMWSVELKTGQRAFVAIYPRDSVYTSLPDIEIADTELAQHRKTALGWALRTHALRN